MIRSVKTDPCTVLFTCAIEADCATAKGHVDVTAQLDDLQKLADFGLSAGEPRALENALLQRSQEERLQQALSQGVEAELCFSFDFELTGRSSVAVTASTLVVDHDQGVTRYVDLDSLRSQPGVTVITRKS
jgi:hypothetical protein